MFIHKVVMKTRFSCWWNACFEIFYKILPCRQIVIIKIEKARMQSQVTDAHTNHSEWVVIASIISNKVYGLPYEKCKLTFNKCLLPLMLFTKWNCLAQLYHIVLFHFYTFCLSLSNKSLPIAFNNPFIKNFSLNRTLAFSFLPL